MTNSDVFDFIETTVKDLLPNENENIDTLIEALYALDRNKIHLLNNKESIKNLIDKKTNGIRKLLRSDKTKSEIEKNLYDLLSDVNKHMTVNENIVKRTCKELGITQKELAERLGVNDGTVRKWASQTEPPEWGVKFLNTLIENKSIKEKYNLFKNAFEMIDKARG